MADNKYRLVTRSDMDGLVCAVLLKELNMVDEIVFVHPKDMQDTKIEITGNDITTNLPYVEGCHLCFDHHLSETIRNVPKENHIILPDADSAARVVYDYYGGVEKFGSRFDDMMTAVDKADAAKFSKEDILNPRGWDLLSFIMDARTGLGRFREFRISNYNLMMDLIDYCKDHTIDEIMELPDVKERTELYHNQHSYFIDQLKRCSTVHKNLVVLDLRHEDTIYAGNRFMIYALYPETNISIHVLWGFKKQNIVFACGNSILNRTSKTNIGDMMLDYNGGGHENAGTCQIDLADAEKVMKKLVKTITLNG
jgi:nanoRNase/pAp phosphatase (c-di-AMP/oligoRNAs hydrolase)